MAKDRIWFEKGDLRFKARVEGMSKSQLRARLEPLAAGARLSLMKNGDDPTGPEADALAAAWCQSEINDLRLNKRLAQKRSDA